MRASLFQVWFSFELLVQSSLSCRVDSLKCSASFVLESDFILGVVTTRAKSHTTALKEKVQGEDTRATRSVKENSCQKKHFNSNIFRGTVDATQAPLTTGEDDLLNDDRPVNGHDATGQVARTSKSLHDAAQPSADPPNAPLTKPKFKRQEFMRYILHSSARSYIE